MGRSALVALARTVACPKCGAKPHELCKRLTVGRYSHVDGVHKERKDVASHNAIPERDIRPESPE